MTSVKYKNAIGQTFVTQEYPRNSMDYGEKKTGIHDRAFLSTTDEPLITETSGVNFFFNRLGGGGASLQEGLPAQVLQTYP